jgi:hypothetical protein
MSTYAVYRIWCGLLRSQWEEDLETDLSVGLMLDELTGKKIDGLEFEDQFMNGQRIGFGVTIRELDWTVADELEKECLYDPGQDNEAVATVQSVEKVFASRGIKLAPRLFHLLDLGG